MRSLLKSFIAVSSLALATGATAAYPDKPIKLVVPYTPGGVTDALARYVAKGLAERIGQPVVVENRGGGGANIGADVVAKAPADGYTLLLYSVHGAVAASAFKNLSYDLERDLVPVTTVAIFPDVLVAADRVPAKSLPELVAYAKANPGKINCGSAGNGTSRHLSCEMFNAQAGIKATHVPYKGTGPATTALLAGEIDYIFEALGSASAHIRAGKIKPIAVTSAKRSPSFPEIPTAMESGLPAFEVTSWYGLWVPVGTPPAVIRRLQAAVAKAFEEQDMKDLWFKLGAEPGGSASEEFRALVNRDVAKWGKVVREANISVE